MNTITDWQLSLGVDDILRGQGADPQVVRAGKPLLMAVAERAITQGVGLIHPIALTHTLVVRQHRHTRILLEGGATLTGPLVTRHLAGAQRVVAAVCTIGPELEGAITQWLPEDPAYAMALDGLGNAAVEILSQQVCGRIAEQVQVEGLQASTPLSPGNPEWAVGIGQPQIFALLDPSEAGITLTSGGMMIPKKSVSFVLGLGSEMSQAGLCEVCSLKDTCRYRRA
ncbi:MAG: hypothetical protein WCE68_06990 [Anaerolineales bacterium]